VVARAPTRIETRTFEREGPESQNIEEGDSTMKISRAIQELLELLQTRGDVDINGFEDVSPRQGSFGGPSTHIEKEDLSFRIDCATTPDTDLDKFFDWMRIDAG